MVVKSDLSPGNITPHLSVRKAEKAIEFYERAFGAKELYRSTLPHSDGIHVQLNINGVLVMLTEEAPAEQFELEEEAGIPLRSPESLGGTSMILELFVDDADAAFQRAVDAGALPMMAVEEMFWGDRFGMITDPFGHVWAVAQVMEYVTPEEVHERMTAFMKQVQEQGVGGQGE